MRIVGLAIPARLVTGVEGKWEVLMHLPCALTRSYSIEHTPEARPIYEEGLDPLVLCWFCGFALSNEINPGEGIEHLDPPDPEPNEGGEETWDCERCGVGTANDNSICDRCYADGWRWCTGCEDVITNNENHRCEDCGDEPTYEDDFIPTVNPPDDPIVLATTLHVQETVTPMPLPGTEGLTQATGVRVVTRGPENNWRVMADEILGAARGRMGILLRPPQPMAQQEEGHFQREGGQCLECNVRYIDLEACHGCGARGVCFTEFVVRAGHPPWRLCVGCSNGYRRENGERGEGGWRCSNCIAAHGGQPCPQCGDTRGCLVWRISQGRMTFQCRRCRDMRG